MATAGAVVDRMLRRLATNSRRLELPWKVAEDLAHVSRTMSRLQDMLVTLENQYFKIPANLQDWMRKIKQIAYDMEDLLDEFEDPGGIGSLRSGSWIAKAASICLATSFSLRLKRLKVLRRKLELAAKDSVVYSLMPHTFCGLKPPNEHQVFDASTIFGRDIDKEKIKGVLMQNDSDNITIIPIVGLPGLGKTTLARLIFHDQVGEGWNFDRRVWIDLDRKLELNKIASQIILQVNQTKEVIVADVTMSDQIQNNLQSMKNRLWQVLHDKSCLIVLDGLFSTDKNQLAELKDMLKSKKKCTKIIVTTSSENSAELLHTVPPFKLGPISESDCWKMFCQRAFGNGDENTLVGTRKTILKKCEGIPVLAYSFGTLVCNMDDSTQLLARNKEIWELEKIFSSDVEVLTSFTEMYYNMPLALKLCFVYLSVFPRGCKIDKDKLIQQWMALELVGSKHGSLPAYVYGDMYIQELLSISFLQIEGMPSATGTSHTCGPSLLQVHNLVHAFAKYVAGNDLIILDGEDLSIDPYGEMITFYSVVVNNDTGNSTRWKDFLTRARVVSFRNCSSSKLLADSLLKLNHLRVLDLTSCSILELPASIGHLKYLRYLDSSGLKIRSLPNQMSSLQNLETLDLSESYLEELRTFVGWYQKLMYLNLRACVRLKNLPPTLGDLKKLQYLNLSQCSGVSKVLEFICGLVELRFLDLSSCTELQQLPHLFGDLTNLEDLNLSGCSSLRNLPESIGHLYFLRFLNLSDCSELQKLPEYIVGLVNLQYLNLAHVFLELTESLSKLERLETLDITGYCLSLSSYTPLTFSGILQKMPNLKLVLTDDSGVESYLSQRIQSSTEIRNVAREVKVVHSLERASELQLQISPYEHTLQETNVGKENTEILQDQTLNEITAASKEFHEEDILERHTSGYVSKRPESTTAISCLPFLHRDIKHDDPITKLDSVRSVSTTPTEHNDPFVGSDFKSTKHPDFTDRPSKLRVFSFSELKNATNNFSRSFMVGEGEFGYVYRGVVVTTDEPSEQIEVAVKKLRRNECQGQQEWLTEANVHGMVQHPNLVKLIGYCVEGDEEGPQRFLVYEYMVNGSVDDHLRSRSTSTLSWPLRLKVALDSARGLKYLHEEMDFQVIFPHLKPSNILFDENWNAKLSDILPVREAHASIYASISEVVTGALGYEAPEYLQAGQLTAKSNVWSYGVLLYQLITGRQPIDRNRPKAEQKLLVWVKPYISSVKRFSKIVDPRLEGHYNLKYVIKLGSVANRCLVREPKSRPKMCEVYEMVQKIVDVDSVDVTAQHHPQRYHGLVPESSAKRSNKR